jgi:hypothetical protein
LIEIFQLEIFQRCDSQHAGLDRQRERPLVIFWIRAPVPDRGVSNWLRSEMSQLSVQSADSFANS